MIAALNLGMIRKAVIQTHRRYQGFTLRTAALIYAQENPPDGAPEDAPVALPLPDDEKADILMSALSCPQAGQIT